MAIFTHSFTVLSMAVAVQASMPYGSQYFHNNLINLPTNQQSAYSSARVDLYQHTEVLHTASPRGRLPTQRAADKRSHPALIDLYASQAAELLHSPKVPTRRLGGGNFRVFNVCMYT